MKGPQYQLQMCVKMHTEQPCKKTFSRCMYAFCLQAMIALDQVPGWWQCDAGSKEMYPMDYYAKDGGSWNSTWHQKSARIKAKA